MTKVVELFGVPTDDQSTDWKSLVRSQKCPFLSGQCIKVRKSQPGVAIGTCTLSYGRQQEPVIVCPHRLLERHQIFTDCLHLLTNHIPGNELHILRELSIPGGNVDFVLASVNGKKVHDFVAIELQSMDTTGTIWPERQRFLKARGMQIETRSASSAKTFGINWKMTAKTTLVQLHHKIQTFEYINKHLVLVMQDHLLRYMQREFRFDHLHPAVLGDPMQLHAYHLDQAKGSRKLTLALRLSTDATGVAQCLGLQADANLELADILRQIEARISDRTLFALQ